MLETVNRKKQKTTTTMAISQKEQGSPLVSSVNVDDIDDRTFKNLKYARIIDLIVEKQHIQLEEARDMLYSSPLFALIDDGTADLICRSDLYLADEIIRIYKS